MANRINISQLRSKLRQIENQQRQAINKYNSQVRQYNNSVKKAISDYNAAVRKYNAVVNHNRQIINSNIRKLNSSSFFSTTYSVSLTTMQRNYHSVNEVYNEGSIVTDRQNKILDLIEQEQANSIVTTQVVESPNDTIENTEDIEIGNKLINVSIDLNNRWKGAVFSLNPNNPDAARHFCTSAREIFTEFIELKAPDNEVFQFNPTCEKTNQGNATRREKIKYMMRNIQMDECVVDFAESDITNILELFHILSNGTHGEAGRIDMKTLFQVKKRVEQGISFLCEISA